jgi:hypothetical protein
MSTQREPIRRKPARPTDDSSSLTASAPIAASEPPPHLITLHRGDGVVIRYEFPAKVLRARRAARGHS